MRFSAFVVLAVLFGSINGHAEDLLFSRIPTPIRMIVCELPDTTTEQARVVVSGLKQAFPQAEVLDAGGLDEVSLREKLKSPFVLFTLLNPKARLLGGMAQRLPFRMENGDVKWDDFSGPAQDLRVIFVAPNPYGTGLSAVFAAGSLGLLRGGNSGDYSYEIANERGPVRTGFTIRT